MKKSKRLVCLLLSVVMLLCTSFTFVSGSAKTLGQQKNELESELAALKSQSAQLKEQYNDAKKDVNDQKRVINLIYDQIETAQKELETISSLMQEYSALAAQKEKEIDELNEQMNKNYELFKQRLVFAQESGNMSYIDFILGSSDLSDIISRGEVINDMLEYDRKMIESLLEDRKTIEKAKEEIDQAIADCAAKQEEYDATVAELRELETEAKAKLKEYENDVAASQLALNRAEAAKKEAEKKLNAIVEEIARQSQGTFSGTFIWPLPATNPGYISQYYGGGHSGLDIGVGGWVNNGKVPALAIASGKVTASGSNYHWSWGNLVVIDHGGGYVSYYAHLDSISVSVGQQVSQGQQIGKIGSTGNSTGPHLHIVIYEPTGNGSKICDPLKYISYPR
ncbi:MAG: peptidoglycan DD-metalloendopeptidase family protein [Clostridia bacterium]|nr:peptidoglycan DD-metalloendopeptidase family protein [Clostridia bacterium]